MVRPVLLASLAVAACLGPASAETVVKGPGDLSINCDDFRLYPNGTIEADKDATLVYPDKKGSFADATFGPQGVFVGRHRPRRMGQQKLQEVTRNMGVARMGGRV